MEQNIGDEVATRKKSFRYTVVSSRGIVAHGVDDCRVIAFSDEWCSGVIKFYDPLCRAAERRDSIEAHES